MELGLILILFLMFALVVYLFRNNLPYNFIMRVENAWATKAIRNYSNWSILLFSCIMVWSLFGRITAAQWNVIDDHEIMRFLGPDRRLLPSEILSTLKQTEVGNFGSYPRFRPTYYFLRITETAYCGANPFCWHINRLVILWLGVAIIWILASRHLGWLGGGIMCAYILTFHLWVDTIGRLGAGEAYAVLGLPLYMWGIAGAFTENHERKNDIKAGLSILLGSILCVGSKENFLLLLIPSVYMIFKAIKDKRYYILLPTVGSVAFTVFIGTAVWVLMSTIGMDEYANAVSPLGRLEVFIHSISSFVSFLPIAIMSVLMIILAGTLLSRAISLDTRKTILYAIFWFGVLLIIYCSQIVFYSGAFPLGNRYDYPGILYIPAAIVLLYILAEKILSKGYGILVSKYVLGTILTCGLSLAIVAKGYTHITESLDRLVVFTTDYTNSVVNISSVLKQKNDYALVMESRSVWDLEYVYSYERFLRAYGVTNVMFLRISCYSPDTVTSDREKLLATELYKISSQGNSLFYPLSGLDSFENQCFSLQLRELKISSCIDPTQVPNQCPASE